MLEIKDLLKRDITRNVTGVVVAEQKETEQLKEELGEYVVTKEVKEQMQKIFSRYEASLEKPTQDIGIWIAGFFGSGKSHLLKMVANLIENREIDGKRAVQYFEEKLENSKELYEIMKKSGNRDTDVLLFNIENVNNQQDSQSKDAIVTAFLKKFNEMQGFSKDILKIAEFERNLWKRGRYDEFRNLYQDEADIPWEDDRNDLFFARDIFLDVVEKMQIPGFSREAADKMIDDINNPNMMPSPSNFVDLLEEYLTYKGNNHRMIFCVDEVGQYIGGDSKLMLNLQTLVEEVGTRLKGRVWIGVTSQQNMDAILEGAESKKNDFSRIQGRFKTMISLSSSNIDEIIKKRLLEKKPEHKKFLKNYYESKRVNISNSINFQDTPAFKLYDDSEDFADTYPFVRYQFNLLQDIFDKIRVTGLAGKHLSRGERSLLNAFQEAGIKIKSEEVGGIVPFHYFYDSIEYFLDGDGKRPVQRAINDYKMDRETVDLLKLLFLLKGMNDKIKSTVDNLTAFMVSKVDEDTKELKERLKKSLRNLEKHNLIQREADEYFYLTNEEQSIMKEIKSINVTSKEITEHLSKVIYNDILTSGTITVKETNTTYAFTKKIDDITLKAGEVLGIALLTPESEEYDKPLSIISRRDGMALTLKLSEEEVRYLEETKQFLQIQKYNEDKGIFQKRETLREIIDKLVAENRRNRSERIRTYLENAISNSTIYISGSEIKINKKNAEALMKDALEELAKTLFNKAEMIRLKYDEKRIREVLSEETTLQFDFIKETLNNPNKDAMEEVLRQIKNLSLRDEQITMKKLVDKYKNIPFGWKELDVQGLVTELYVYSQVDLEFNGEKVKDRKVAANCLTKTQTSNQEKLLIIPREDIDPNLKVKVTNSLKKVFGQNIQLQEDDILESIKNSCGKSRNNVGRYLEYYNRSTEFKYPGEQLLKEWKEDLDEILKARGRAKQFIDNYLEVAENLLAINDEVEEVTDFFDNQKDIFDSAIEKLNTTRNNKAVIGSVLESEAARNMIAVLLEKNPYGKITKIKDYMVEMEKEILVLVKSEKERLKKEAEKKIDEYRTSFKDHNELLKIVETEYKNFIFEIEKIEDIKIFQQSHVLNSLSNKIVGHFKGELKKQLVAREKNVTIYLQDKEEKEKKLCEVQEEFNTIFNKINMTTELKYLDTISEEIKEIEKHLMSASLTPRKERVEKRFKVVAKRNMETESDVEKYMEEMQKQLEILKEEILTAIRENKKVDVI